MTEPVLEIRDLQVQFVTPQKTVVAVDNVDLQLQRGQTLGIVGESGSGKSVTSLAIMGLIPYPGKVTNSCIDFYGESGKKPINLQQVSEETRRLYRGGKIAMIFQEPMSALNPVYNIGFQITEAIHQHQQVSSPEARRQAIARLQEVKLIPSDEQLQERFSENREINLYKQDMLKRFPHELSGGQLQRVCIAMAICCNPTLLIADEPTTALDVTIQAGILDLLRELCQSRGMSMIFITHDLGVIANIADTVAVMYQGKIVETGNLEDIFTNPQHPYTQGLLACRPRLEQTLSYLPTVADFMEIGQDGQLVSRETSTEILSSEPQDSQRLEELLSQSPLLSVKNLQVGFPLRGMLGRTQRYLMAVQNISFQVYPGETLGLVGESGCGKSTLARTLLRLIEPLQGNITFEGEDITHLKGKRLRRLRREMQIIFQNPYNSLNPRLTVGKAILEPMEIHGTENSSKARKKRVDYLLERVGLDPRWLNRYPHEFSGGQRQRICIARALALNPRFIICDESVSALDVSVQAQVLNLLKELQQEFGLTYIFISHDLSVVKFMSDRIMVMNQGKIEEIGAAEQIYQQPQRDYTQKLIAAIPTGEFVTSNS